MTYQESVWDESPSLKSYTLSNFRDLPQIQELSEETQFEMEVVGNVLPFKANNYVVEQLIDWNDIPNDPMYVLTFPQKGMLKPEHYEKMANALKNNSDKKEIASVAPHVSGSRRGPDFAARPSSAETHRTRRTRRGSPASPAPARPPPSRLQSVRWPYVVASRRTLGG